MDEDRPEDTTLSPDSGRAKRAPPTIDLEASEVSGETKGAGAAAGAGDRSLLVLSPAPNPRRSFCLRRRRFRRRSRQR